ncbi:hypothetical protein X777_16871, partial [Ooceraea biroi]
MVEKVVHQNVFPHLALNISNSLTWAFTMVFDKLRSSRAHSKWPVRAAQYNGVFPAASKPVPDIPCFKYSFRNERLPRLAASCNATTLSTGFDNFIAFITPFKKSIRL